MNPVSTSIKIWLVGVAFVLFQFFLQLSSGVVIGSIMHEMQLSALTAGMLSASFYLVYTSLQIPVGILFDRKNPRILLAGSAFLCGIGCFIFAANDVLLGLFVGRILIGIGASFAFVGLSHALRHHFPTHQFAFMIGLSETIGFLATVVGIMGMGTFIEQWGWRGFINIAGCIGIMIAISAWIYIPKQSIQPINKKTNKGQVSVILSNPILWINGLFIGLTFSLITVFGAMWAPSFLQVKLNCNLEDASWINALFFLGTGLSCPLFGWLSTRLSRRKPLIFASSLSTTLLFFTLLYLPTQSALMISGLMFLIGLCCGAYILAFPIANEIAPKDSLSTSTGFINTLALITTPLLQPLIGYCLDLSSETGTVYTLENYQHALLVIPFCLIIAGLLARHLPEKKQPLAEFTRNELPANGK